MATEVVTPGGRGVSSEPWGMATKVVTPGGVVVQMAAGLPIDARIARVADAQHGVISLAQLGACGLGPSGARARVVAGRLHRIYRGVFTPGHRRLPALGKTSAAVLACGPGAAASHLTAAWLHALRKDGRSLIDVTVATRTGRRHGNVITHSAASLRSVDLTAVDGIVATSVVGTLLDCAPILGRRGTEKLCQQAGHRDALDVRALGRLLAHVPGHPGARTLRLAIADMGRAKGMPLPGHEERLLMAFRAAGLPEPECNAPIQLADTTWYVADFLWRSQHLIVEADSLRWHDNPAAYRGDRRRDRALKRVGYDTVRFSDEDMHDPAACAGEVTGFLVQTGGESQVPSRRETEPVRRLPTR